jgi:hypothetical protein
LEKARKADERGELSDTDKYVINWFIAGVTTMNWSRECFKEGTFTEMWEAIHDSEKMDMIRTHPILQYCCDTLDAAEAEA